MGNTMPPPPFRSLLVDNVIFTNYYGYFSYHAGLPHPLGAVMSFFVDVFLYKNKGHPMVQFCEKK